MGYQTILVERHGLVELVTMNRPEVRNAQNTALITELDEAMRAADDDPAVNVIVLAGAGKDFSAGHDLKAYVGEAPSDEAKKQIEDTIRGIDNVKDVVNEMQVAGASSYAARGADSLVTSNVKARMVNNGKFSPMHVKVVTEAGVVYLMGIVDKQEAEAAVDIARTTSGVSRVVKVFEYMQ